MWIEGKKTKERVVGEKASRLIWSGILHPDVEELQLCCILVNLNNSGSKEWANTKVVTDMNTVAAELETIFFNTFSSENESNSAAWTFFVHQGSGLFSIFHNSDRLQKKTIT